MQSFRSPRTKYKLCGDCKGDHDKFQDMDLLNHHMHGITKLISSHRPIWASIHKVIRRLTAKSPEVSKPHLGSTAAEVPVKFHSDWKSLKLNLVSTIILNAGHVVYRCGANDDKSL